MKLPTNTSKMYPAERMNWRDKLESNALGLLAWLVLVIFGFGVVGLCNFIRSFL